jgi:hypothetical protein
MWAPLDDPIPVRLTRGGVAPVQDARLGGDSGTHTGGEDVLELLCRYVRSKHEEYTIQVEERRTLG